MIRAARSITVLVLIFAAAAAQPDRDGNGATADSTCDTTVLTILIAAAPPRDDSFKDDVISRLSDSLSARGHRVVREDLQALKSLSAGAYAAVIVLDAIDADKLRRPVRGFVSRSQEDNSRSRVLVSTVSGDTFRDRQSTVHGTTAATRTYSPSLVAARILKKVDDVLACPVPDDEGE